MVIAMMKKFHFGKKFCVVANSLILLEETEQAVRRVSMSKHTAEAVQYPNINFLFNYQ